MPNANDAAWVDVLPSLAKFTPELNRALRGIAPKAGQQAGAEFSDGFRRAAVSGVEKASSALAAARKKEADAAGAVRVAEARLNELRDSGRAKTAQLVSAEERLEKAKRGLDSATDSVTRSTRSLSDAQQHASRDARQLDSSLDRVDKRTSVLRGGLARLGGAIAAVGLGRLFVGFVEDAQESERISRLTEAAIRSTGGAANVTADQVNRLATAVSNKTAVDDEAVQAASNVLLAFTQVRNEAGRGNDVFNQATQAAIDMSAAMGTDANAAAKQLGRALNDPIGSLGALSRAGVQFTAQQREQIKAMVEAGDTLGAQKVILDAVQTRFGGAAAAAANPLERLKVIAGNLGEEIGGALLPVIGRFASFVSDKVIPGVKALFDLLVHGNFTSEFARVFGVSEDSGLVDFLFTVREAFAAAFNFVRNTVIPTLVSLGQWVVRNREWLAPLAIAIGSVALAVGTVVKIVKLWTAAQRILNIVLAANPIILVITVVASLIAALVAAYHSSETFRKIVDAAFRVVAEAGRWMWENILRPVFTALQATWTALSTAIQWAWDHLIKPTWTAVSSTAQFLWNSVLKPVFSFISAAWNAVGVAIGWVWSHLIKPIWDGVSNAIRWLWNNVLSPVFTAISAAWDAVGRAIGSVYNRLIKPIIDGFGRAVTWVKDTFQSAVDGIERIWNTIKEILRAPVQWVIDVVWNNGLRKLWNWINNLWGGNDLQPFTFANGGVIDVNGRRSTGGSFADGGVMPGYTPGRDVHRFFSPTGGILELSGGEPVLRPEIGRALGRATIDQWNAAARTGGVEGFKRAFTGGAWRREGLPVQAFAKGGTVSLPGWLDDALGFLGAPIATAVRATLGPINNSGGEGGGEWGQMIWGFVKNTAAKLFEKAKSLFDVDIGAAAGSGGTFPLYPNGWPPRRLGVLASNTALMVSLIRRAFPQITSIGTIGSRPNASDHPYGKAADFMIPGWNTASGKTLGYKVAAALASWSKTIGLKYMIFNDLITSGRGWGRYTHPNGATSNPTLRHLDHVHASVYDGGGPVPPGLSMVYNGTGATEVARILTPDQDTHFQHVMAGRTGGGAGAVSVVGIDTGGGDINVVSLDALMREQRRETRRALTALGLTP